MSKRQIICLFGVSEDTIRERLMDDVLSNDALVTTLSIYEELAMLQFEAQEDATVDWAVNTAFERLGGYIYSDKEQSLEELAVSLLTQKGKTVALAESCTGGLLASRLTGVSGCSQVFGTGVVSYSWDCKKRLLGVSADTLDTHGAVSDETAREMADGIRRQSGADIGIAITGEAGPNSGEGKPVGTVFVALADARRTWVKMLQLDATKLDRAAIRRVAASYALDMLRRYLQAYPTVMAGGERHSEYTERRRQLSQPSAAEHRLVSAALPWRGNRKWRLLKIIAWIAVLATLIVGMVSVYNRMLIPMTNRELQDDLANLYWDNTQDLTNDQPNESEYPIGMMAQFRGLYDINEDIAGWIRIPETTINYPVTVYADGYYGNHNFNDQYSVYGQPHFYDGNTRDTLQTDTVLAIRGNNTRDAQMFSSLLSYRRIAYLREHPFIEMNTVYNAAWWEIFAVAVVDERDRASNFDYFCRNFAEDAAYDAYIEGLCRRSLFRTNVKPTNQEPLLLLVTNAEKEYGFSGARLVIAARKTVAEQPQVKYAVNPQMTWPTAYKRATTTRSTSTTVATTTTTVTTWQTTTSVTQTSDDITTTTQESESTTTVTEDIETTTTTMQSEDTNIDDMEKNDNDHIRD